MAEQQDPKPNAKPGLIRKDPLEGRESGMAAFMRTMPAWIVSAAVHAVLLGLFFLILGDPRTWAEAPVDDRAQITEFEVPPPEPNFENLDIGLDPNLELAYDVKRIDDNNVPGPEDPTDAVGIDGAPEAPAMDIPPPPGTQMGQGGAPTFDAGAAMKDVLQAGGYSFKKFKPGGFKGRSGATKKHLLTTEGGNTESEAAVGRGLKWLALHQAPAGFWSLDEFPRYHRDDYNKPIRNMMGKLRGTASRKNDIAGTAFGLLPFFGAGYTHQKGSFAKTVGRGLTYLISKQDKRTGNFGGGMYAHGLAAIAMCEAYALTSDPRLKRSAQAGINYIVYAQDPEAGGWRYQPRKGSDTSVVGWQLMALKSGQMAGLNVPSVVLKNAERYLDSVEKKNSSGKGTGQFGYTTDAPKTTMSAVGMLCRQYLGEPLRSPTMLNGIPNLLKNPANRMAPRNMYYTYYASQVMHHVGGDAWKKWNEGEGGRTGMRDTLIDLQERRGPAMGSWDPRGESHGDAGGRIMKTSLCLLSLEVYYRHLPLYRRNEVMAEKKMDGMEKEEK